MTALEQAILVGLGAWRLSAMLVYEDGPWDVFARLRQRAGIVPGEINGFWALLLSCIWCTSIWVGSGLWLLSEVSPLFAAVPAAWAVSLVAERWIRG